MKMRNLMTAIALLLLSATVVAGNPAKGKYDWIYGEDNPYGPNKKERKKIEKEMKELGGNFNSAVDAWRDDDDIAKRAVWFGGYYMEPYVKVLDASIGYLKRVLCEGSGDASFVNRQTEELNKLSSKMTEAVFGARGISRKDAAKIIKKMADKYNTRNKEYYRVQLIDEIERRGIFKVNQGVFSEPERSVARKNPRDSGNAAVSSGTATSEPVDLGKLLGPDPEFDKKNAELLSKAFGPDPEFDKKNAELLSKAFGPDRKSEVKENK